MLASALTPAPHPAPQAQAGWFLLPTELVVHVECARTGKAAVQAALPQRATRAIPVTLGDGLVAEMECIVCSQRLDDPPIPEQ